MIKKNKLSLGLLTVALAAAGVTGATVTVSKTFTNKARYDTVDISLKLGKLSDQDNDGLALPNENIDQPFTISNKGAVAYIRVVPKVTELRKDGKTKPISGINLTGKNWKKGKDGNFYYMKPLVEYKKSAASCAFKMPASWNNKYENGKVKIKIKAEAVQQRHFVEHGDIIKSWKGITVHKTVRTRTSEVSKR